jgi:hypothetical protein
MADLVRHDGFSFYIKDVDGGATPRHDGSTAQSKDQGLGRPVL